MTNRAEQEWPDEMVVEIVVPKKSRRNIPKSCGQCGKTVYRSTNEVNTRKSFYCDHKCRGLAIRGNRKSLWDILVKRDNGCWEWPFPFAGYYPQYKIGKNHGAHRAAWILTHGEIPDGLCVCHKCDNPKCANPSHLFLGTIRENSLDSWLKGRSVRGETVGNSKLTETEVAEIREQRRSGRKLIDIAKDFNVDLTNISMIARGKTWKHI